MNPKDFDRIHIRNLETKPKVFQAFEPDRCPSEQDINDMESATGIRLPSKYRLFLRNYGGGNFGFVVIFSGDCRGEWYLPVKQREARQFLPDNCLAFSDDFAGGYYVFKVADGVAEDKVYYWNFDGGIAETPFNDILEFIAHYAYEPK